MRVAEPDLIIRVATHPRNWPYLSEDGQRPQDYRPNPVSLYFAHGEMGFASLSRMGRHLWGCHIAMLPGTTGVTGFSRVVMQHAADSLGARTLMASIPDNCRAAKLLARRIGFRHCGRIERALSRNGKMIALDIFQVHLA
jgi:hypothetical protein